MLWSYFILEPEVQSGFFSIFSIYFKRLLFKGQSTISVVLESLKESVDLV